MPFLLPNQQFQSTEGEISHSMDLLTGTPSSPGGLPTLSLTTNSSWLTWGRVDMPLISPLMPVPWRVLIYRRRRRWWWWWWWWTRSARPTIVVVVVCVCCSTFEAHPSLCDAVVELMNIVSKDLNKPSTTTTASRRMFCRLLVTYCLSAYLCIPRPAWGSARLLLLLFRISAVFLLPPLVHHYAVLYSNTSTLIIEWLRERTEHLDIFFFSAHHSVVFYFRCTVYWWKESLILVF